MALIHMVYCISHIEVKEIFQLWASYKQNETIKG